MSLSHQDHYKSLYAELDQYEKQGVVILVDGQVRSPLQAVQTFMAEDIRNYMRDYIMDDSGKLEALGFDYVGSLVREKPAPLHKICYDAFIEKKMSRTFLPGGDSWRRIGYEKSGNDTVTDDFDLFL